MKLKKIASLMLAGVMAISMLAGCSGKGETKPEEPATGVNATTVIAALDKTATDKVTFSASSSLQTTLENALKITGESVNVTTVKKNMQAIDSTLSQSAGLPVINTKEDDDKAVQSFLSVVSFGDANSAYVDKYINEQLADAIEKVNVYNTTLPCSKLPAYSDDYGTNKDYYYTFAYTADVAVAEVTNTLTGATTYVAAFTITRTPTKAATPSK